MQKRIQMFQDSNAYRNGVDVTQTDELTHRGSLSAPVVC